MGREHLIPWTKGDPRAREHGRLGGQVTAAMRRKAKGPYQGSVLDVMCAAGLSGESWRSWRSVLSAVSGLPLSPRELALSEAHTGRSVPPPGPVSECWVVAGRRGGKSRIAALVAFTKALQFDAGRLAHGELAVVPVIAADRRQARVVLHYLKALCDRPEFRPYVHRITREVVALRTAVNVEVHTASYRTIRGYTVVAAVLDEVAFWRDESTSTNPDSEILDALRPGMATVPDSLLFAISSPYARRGELFQTYERYFGQDDLHVLVVNADTRSLNSTVPEHVIERAYAEDPIAAASEYGRDGRVEFRRDVEQFLDPEAVVAVTVTDRRELPPVAGIEYRAFVDPSGGSQDSFAVAVAHRDDADRTVLDAVRERRPPFSPDAVVQEFADLLHSYRITEIVGDRYAGEWPREAFRAHGIRYVPSERTKSDLYRELVPPVNAGRVELLDLPVLRAQLLSLERRVARGGRDSIDHPPGGRDDLANAAAGALVTALGLGRPAKKIPGVWVA